MEKKEELIRLYRVKKSVRDNQVIEELNLTLYGGEVTGFVGDEDSGADILCHILSGNTDFQGHFYCQGEAVENWQEDVAWRAGVMRLHTGSSLIESFNVAENLCMLRTNAQVPLSERLCVHQKNIHLLSKEYLRDWGMEIDTYKYPSELSLSEKLLVLIIRAEMCHCRLLILDHVCGRLTKSNGKLLQHIFPVLKKKGITVIVAERHPEWIENLVDRILIFQQGTIIGDYYANEYRHERVWHILSASERMIPEMKPGRGFGQDLDLHLLHEKNPAADNKLLIHKGEILGISDYIYTWEEFLESFPLVEDLASGKRQNQLVLLGEEDNFGLFSGWSQCENISMHILRNTGNKLGVLQRHLLEFAYHESYPQICDDDAAWKSIDTMNLRERLHLAMESCRKAKPLLLFMTDIDHNMDVVHMQALCDELALLSKEGIAVVLWNPVLSAIRQCCGRMLMLRQGVVQQEFIGQELEEERFGQYMYSWYREVDV